jgi:hypothetical protein
MSQFHAIAPSTHGAKRWVRYTSHAFAARDGVAALVAHEFSKACTSLPMAFIWRGERFLPVAVQGLASDVNLFVAPDGRWLGRYTPAVYRSYPFALAPVRDHNLVLCVDHDSGLLHDDAAPEQGTTPAAQRVRFYDDQGQLDPAVRDVMAFLEKIQASRVLTERICAALNTEGLLVPWVVAVKTPSGARQLAGLYRVDEAKLQALPAEALHRLNQVGALSAAHCQLVSMQHIQLLGHLSQLHTAANDLQQGKAPAPRALDPDPISLNRYGSLLFGESIGI